ncbi:EAL domain-containing protein [Asticcacaulis sp. AND118]|uniref:EAL domain-containing protein n=1 Tax=Asticcacaulis sp. AND118 TaxID=2840468 RepID=UPI001CFF5AD9|nr:EAL domain-containing protein [Asticcacaulis sp. AND118]UDF05018.1 EAL domain-containing protein [Asticcacaulis sp. AND118]
MRKRVRISRRGQTHRGFHSRLNRLVVGCVLLACLPVAALFVANEASRYGETRWSTLKAAADVLASSTYESVEGSDATGAFRAIRAVTRTPGIVYARVETPAGVMAETGSGARLKSDVSVDGKGAPPSLSHLLSTGSIEIRAPIEREGRTLGHVVVVHRASGIGAGLFRTLAGIGLMAVASAGIALLIANRLQRRLVRPLSDLTRTIAAVAESGNFTRVETQADDEVRTLVDGFNLMAEAIDKRDRQIEAHVQELESEVTARTQDYRVARDEANAANAAKSEFLATMSHEIRTPMNGVMVMAELLAGEALPPKARRHADTIVRSGRNLLSVINDILDFSKIEAGRMDVEISEVDIVDLIDEVVALFHDRAREKGLELVAFVHPNAPRLVPADRVRLGQVIANLVSNAVKFTERGHVTIRLIPDRDPGQWRLVVADTGIGIAADKLDSVFGAFTQEDQTTTRRFGGTGLGLSIARRLVEAMNGAIAVTSEQGKGTQFHVRLPRQAGGPVAAPPRLMTPARLQLAVAAPALASALKARLEAAGFVIDDTTPDLILADADNRASLIAGSAPLILIADIRDSEAEAWREAGRCAAVLNLPLRHRDLDRLITAVSEGEPLHQETETVPETVAVHYPRARVLVADDAEVNLEVARESLSRFGIDCTTAINGADALTQMAMAAFDLVLMDGSMPEIDGFEATRRWRARENDTHLPIVALTAHVVGKAAEEWRACGMDAVLHKPFTLQALADILERFLPHLAVPVEGSAPEAETPPLPIQSDWLDPTFDALLRGSDAFRDRVVGLYRAHAPVTLKTLVSALKDNNGQQVASGAHALRSMSLNLGARRLADLAGSIEALARQTPPALRLGDGEALADALAATLAEIDRRLPAAPAAPAPVVGDEDSVLLARLDDVLAQGRLEVMYQPIYDRLGEAIISAECLVRWPSDDTDIVSPAIFVPLAERTGRVIGIGRRVREIVFRDAPRLGELPLAINVSPVELDQPEFEADLLAAVRAADLPPSRFVIEVTETAILGDPERMNIVFERLRKHGFRLALDDFGVGYSSLTALHRHPFDKIKIDQEFVRGLDGEARKALEALAIIQAVSGIGRALGMQVVAEGVETPAQHQHLKAAGVHAMQGYLFSRPLRVDTLVEKTSQTLLRKVG